MAVRTLWKFVVGRAKTLIKNYNVIERAENVMESDKRAPPRHPGTEAKFQVLIKERKDLEADLEKRPVELLDRLKVVKVSSEGSNPEEKMKRQLPQTRTKFEIPTYGYEEPETLAEGKCSLRQALEFISNHQNDPSTHSIPFIAGTYKMKASDVEQVIKHFRAFEIFIGRDKKIGFTKEAMRALGANKIVQPLYRSKFSDMDKKIQSTNNEKQ